MGPVDLDIVEKDRGYIYTISLTFFRPILPPVCGIHTHAALGWDSMGWALLVTQCISMEAFTH